MKKTLQDQYLLIKEGKGHKGVFLADAKRDFPHIVPNHATFDEAAASLKTKNIISENVIGLSAVAGYEPRKKESYETAFEAFLAEARKAKENEDEKVKAEEKKVSKPVEKDLEKNFDYSDDKNPDNLIFDQIMMGYYAEMKDPKNADKTMQQLKDIVLKNLAKDPIHYTKDGQFGVKDLGYVTEHPGLGTPKEPKGKYASSGYGNLSEGMEGTDSLERTARIALERLKVASSLSLKDYTRQELIDALRRASEDRFGNEKLDNLADQLEATLEEAKESWKNRFTEKPSEPKFSDEEKEADRKKKREAELERRRKAGESLEEITLRKAIQEMIDIELEEVRGGGNYGMMTINTANIEKGEQKIPTYYILTPEVRKEFNLLNPGPNAPSYDESLKIPHIRITPDNTIFISDLLYVTLGGMEKGRGTREKQIEDNKNRLKVITNEISDRYWPMVRALFKKYAESKTTIYPVLGKDVLYHQIRFKENGYEVEKLEDWIEKKLEEINDKLAQASSGEVRRGRPINVGALERFKSQLLDMKPNAKGGMAIIPPPFPIGESLMESVEKDLTAINKEAEHEVLQSKLDKIDDLINKRKSQLSKLDEDEDMKALTDKKKVKELQKDIKKLEQAKAKVEKMIGKTKGKKKEVIDETDEMLGDNMMGEDISYEENY
jgi:hypothetical protein